MRRAGWTLSLFVCVAALARCGELAAPCASSQVDCGGACVLPSVDTANCGACGRACGSGQVCVGGDCADDCPAASEKCGAGGKLFCVHTSTDNANCGGCGHACGPGEVCGDGQCGVACPPGTTRCTIADADACISTDSDNQNCGGCGIACPLDAKCVNGACGCTWGTMCQGACVETWMDPWNCGACNRACADTESCTNGTCATVVASGSNGVGDIATDDTYIYWVTKGSIRKCPLDETSATSSLVVPASGGLLALDATNVYWVDTYGGAGHLSLIPKAGGAARVLGYPWSASYLVADDGVVYLPSYGQIRTCPASGCGYSAATFAKTTGTASIRVKDGFATWAEGTSLHRCATSACIDTVIATLQPGFSGLAVDADRAYWANNQGSKNGTIMSVPLAGGIPTTLATGLDDPSYLEVDDSDIYIANWPGTLRMSKLGGPVHQMAGVSGRMALSKKYVFISDGDLLRISK